MTENNNKQIIEKLTYKGVDYSHLWQSDFPSSHEDLITQAYGFVFDDDGKILIIKKILECGVCLEAPLNPLIKVLKTLWRERFMRNLVSE